ncbi:MAG TPA: ribonuclease D [Pseudoxanthomonas sp.]|nr:ribonuclease D [Pseudoxanthomonas sp.]
MPHWIDTPDALASYFTRKPARVGLDTEFVRERTFWPQLALVQLAIGDDILLVDPLRPGMTDALAGLLADPDILKVMHSASEDVVALKYACGAAPQPLFDTQIAAALAGIGAGMGYQKLVEQITGVTLPKGETRSDWLRRPLSDAQLTYAADDVQYLFVLHDELSTRLQADGRLDWLHEDSQRLIETSQQDEGERWPHLALRSAQFLEPPAQHRLLRLLRWRETQARRSDRPRSWILDNEMAVALARTPPVDRAALLRWLDGQPKSPRKLADALWTALDTPLADEAEAPLARSATDRDKSQLKKLQDAVALRTRELGLPEGVLASRRALEALMEFQREAPGGWPAGLAGWRRIALEPSLSPLLTGAD